VESVMGLEGASLCLVLAGDSVTQKVGSVTGKEVGSVTMECHYDTSLSSYYVNWYREKQEAQLQYVLQKGSRGSTDIADFAKKRFSAELQTSTNFTSLTISLLELSDSAVYYCALQPHSDGNQSETRTKTISVFWVCAPVSLGRSSDFLWEGKRDKDTKRT
uniref:Ig-like domain-containing protein n=1 Tax=Callorhinchus milii TaxID=7868 RepID=A0A4W3GY34_CALMI